MALTITQMTLLAQKKNISAQSESGSDNHTDDFTGTKKTFLLRVRVALTITQMTLLAQKKNISAQS